MAKISSFPPKITSSSSLLHTPSHYHASRMFRALCIRSSLRLQLCTALQQVPLSLREKQAKTERPRRRCPHWLPAASSTGKSQKMPGCCWKSVQKRGEIFTAHAAYTRRMAALENDSVSHERSQPQTQPNSQRAHTANARHYHQKLSF